MYVLGFFEVVVFGDCGDSELLLDSSFATVTDILNTIKLDSNLLV